MELQAKHLAPYLPYNLKMNYIVREKVERIGILTNIHHNTDETHPTKISISGLYDDEHIWMFKPHLKSLSKLTDEELIPVGLIIRDVPKHKATFKDNILAIEDAKCWLTRTGMKPTLSLTQVLEINEYLFSIHADVYGLIKNDLAVEIKQFNNYDK